MEKYLKEYTQWRKQMLPTDLADELATRHVMNTISNIRNCQIETIMEDETKWKK